MNENEERQFGHRSRQVLNQGIDVTPGIAERLRRARELALARQRPEPAPVLAWAGNVIGGWGGLALRVLLPVAMLLA
ncbi:MAG: DUF3619 family protein, partial [Burkholderiales bacterium]